MIEIIINGENLQLADDELTIQRRAFIFNGGVEGDDVSTDFDIPASAHNRRLLNLHSEMYNGLGDVVKCYAIVAGNTRTARLTINEVKEEAINVTLYLSTLTADIKGLKLRDLIEDHDDPMFTIVRLCQLIAGESENYPKYIAEESNNLGLYKSLPVATYIMIKDAISMNGIYIDDSLIDSGYLYNIGVLCNSMKLTCPLQCLRMEADANGLFAIAGGQHFVNNVNSSNIIYWTGSAYSFDFSQAQKSIKYNRDCTAYFTLEIDAKAWTSAIRIIVKSNNITQHIYDIAAGSHPNIITHTFSLVIHEDDEVEFFVEHAFPNMMVAVQYGDYESREADGSVDMQLAPCPIEWSDWGSTAGSQPSHVQWAWNYYGIFHNLPDVSVRDWLATIAWIMGCKLVADENYPNQINLVNIDSVNSAEVGNVGVKAIRRATDTFAKRNLISYAEGGEVVVEVQDSGALEDEKELFKSKFINPNSRRGGIAVAPLFKVTVDDSGEVDQHLWKATLTEGNYIGYIDIDSNGDYYLTPLRQLSRLGLPEVINGTIEVEGDTLIDILKCDIITIGGVGFYVVEVEFDAVTGNYNYIAIKID